VGLQTRREKDHDCCIIMMNDYHHEGITTNNGQYDIDNDNECNDNQFDRVMKKGDRAGTSSQGKNL